MPVVLFLADLAPLVMMVGSLIFILLCVAIIKALATSASGAVSWIPGVGGFLKVGIHAAEHKLVGVMTEWADKLDASIGWSLHQIAREIDWLGAEIKSHSNLLYTLGAITLGPGFAAATGAALKGLHIQVGGVASTANLALHRLHLAEKRIARSVALDIYPRLRAVEREARHTIKADIPGLRARAKKIEDELTRLWKAVRVNDGALASLAFVGAVALALERLGGSWIRCSNWNRIGKRVCGAKPQEIEALLGLALGAIAVSDLRTLVKGLQAIEAEAVKGIEAVLRA